MASLLDVSIFSSNMFVDLIRELGGGDVDLSSGSKAKVLSKPDARSIPELIFNGNAVDDEDDDDASLCCAICTDDFRFGERVKCLPDCHHSFHSKCITPWLTQYKCCCPLCMRNIKT